MSSRFWLLIILALGFSVEASALAAAPPVTSYTHSNVPKSTPFGQAVVSQFQPEISPDRIFASRFETGEVLGAVPFTPPEPESILPPPDPTIFPSFGELAGPLYSGPNPIQRGMQGDPIQDYRVAIVRGRVLDGAGQPLAGVLVRALNQREVGYTYSRSSGYYDLVLNGGGDVILDYSKPGLLTSQRRKLTEWRDFSLFPDVVLIAPDALVTPVQLGTGAPAQLASGSSQSDVDGSRTSRVYFPSGSTANLIYADGRTVALPQLMFRATEYTVGARGPERMPGTLPANIAYTFAVELSSDEALSTGAQRVQFNQPLSLYVDNFLSVKTGEAVPLGYYEQSTGEWIGAPNGRVVEVLSITGGVANLDVDGNGVAATPAAYAALGITLEERTVIAQRYAVGANFTRSLISHFTPWDCNWPFYPDPDDEPPPDPEDLPNEDEPCTGNGCEEDEPEDDEPEDPCDSTQDGGSVIDCKTGALREMVPVAGTGTSLNYASNRAPGYRNGSNVVRRRLTGASVPLKLVSASISVAQTLESTTQRYTRNELSANQFVRRRIALVGFYGRPINGQLSLKTTVCFEYPLILGSQGRDFIEGWQRYSARRPLPGRTSIFVVRSAGATYQNCQTRDTAGTSTLRNPSRVSPSAYNQTGQGLGGFALNSHHVLDANTGMLFMGAGEKQRVLTLEGGPGIVGATSDAVLDELPLDLATDGAFALGADGSVYFFEYSENPGDQQINLRKKGPLGSTAIVSSFIVCIPDSKNPDLCNSGQLTPPEQFVVLSDTRTYYLSAGKLFRIDSNTVTEISAIGSLGEACTTAEIATRAGQVFLACNNDLIGGWVGTFSNSENTAPSIERIAGGGVGAANGAAPTDYRLGGIIGLDRAANADLYVAHANPAATLTRFNNLGAQNVELPAGTQALIGVAALNDGVYLTAQDDRAWRHVFSLDLSGNARDFIGNFLGDIGQSSVAPAFGNNQTIAQRERWPTASAPKIGPDGSIFLSHYNKVRRFAPSSLFTPYASLPDGYNVPSKDGRMLYQFDTQGRHLRTMNALTGALMLRFEYNTQGQLTAQIDGDGDVLGITRSASAVRLTAPDGQVTEILLGPGGFASSVHTLATGQQWQLRYNAANTGLLSSFQRPNGHPPSTFIYLNGVLFRDRNARGGGFDFQHFRAANGSDYRQTRIHRIEGGDRFIEKFRSNLLGFTRQTLPDGSSLTTSASGAMAQFSRSPQGMLTISQQQPGALFGLAATFSASASSQTPAGVGFARLNAQNATVPVGAQLGGVNLAMTSNINDLDGGAGRLKLANYNAANRTWSYTSAESRTSTAQIDAQGRPLSSQFADLAPTVYEYDARGRIEKLTVGTGIDARVTELKYDDFGFIRLITDPLLRELVLTNDAIGRTKSMRLPDLREVEFDFDANNNITGVKPPTRDWHRFRYDTTDNLAGYDPPNLAGISAPATDYGYNLHPRLTSITRPDARNITLTQVPGAVGPEQVDTVLGNYRFGYLTGRVQSVEAPPQNDGTATCVSRLFYQFDGTLMTDVTASGCPGAGRVEWQHTGFFEPKTLKITAGSTPTLTTALLRDRDSLLTGVGALVLSRDPINGLLSSTTLSQVSDSYGYNSFAEPENYSVNTPLGAVFSQAFLRDKLGRITQKTESVNSVTTTFDYGYDLAGRLETVKENKVLVATYSFDGNSNRTSKITPSGTAGGTFDAQDRMTSSGGCTYLYTANGEMTRKTCGAAITQFDIDVMGNLRSVTLPNTTQIRYLIDGANRRIGKLRNNVLEKSWLWQTQLHPAAQLDAAGNAQQFYLYGEKVNVPSYLVNRENGANVTYRVISDHLGSVRLVVNAETGVVAQRMRYDEFGVVLEDTNPGFQPFGYAGGFYDADTGLVRFGARDYDAGTGRWIEKDPIGFDSEQENLYVYANSDPVNSIDPSGLICFNFDNFVNDIRDNRFDLHKTLATLTADLAVGTMPKVPSEIRGVGVPKSGLNKYTSQLSRWAGRLNRLTGGNKYRGLRELGRTRGAQVLGTAATGLVIFEGFYDLTIEARAAYDAFDFDENCDCNTN